MALKRHRAALIPPPLPAQSARKRLPLSIGPSRCLREAEPPHSPRPRPGNPGWGALGTRRSHNSVLRRPSPSAPACGVAKSTTSLHRGGNGRGRQALVHPLPGRANPFVCLELTGGGGLEATTALPSCCWPGDSPCSLRQGQGLPRAGGEEAELHGPMVSAPMRSQCSEPVQAMWCATGLYALVS